MVIAIKRHRAQMVNGKLLSEETEKMTANDNAEADLAMKKFIKSSTRSVRTPIEKLTDHSENHFNESSPEIQKIG